MKKLKTSIEVLDSGTINIFYIEKIDACLIEKSHCNEGTVTNFSVSSLRVFLNTNIVPQ